MNQIIEALYQRKSVRVFTEREITKDERDLIINSALQAPTAGNLYLYSIIEVSDQRLKEELAVLCDNQAFIAEAKLVLIFLADYQKYYNLYKIAVNEDVEKPKLGDLMLATADAVIAAQNSVVAAESLGIGSCYIGDILENYEKVRALLQLADFTFPACMLVYGYPTQQQIDRVKPRRFKAEDLVFENRYQEKTAAEYDKMYKGQNENYEYANVARKLHDIKYNVEFRKEMNRSAELYLKKWQAHE